MYQIERIDDTSFYIKAIGTFPPPVAEKFVKEFEELTKNIESNLKVIVDITDAILLKIESIESILDLLIRDNEKLYRTAFVISNNPPLGKEFKFILEKAESPKRRIVSTLNEAKEWLGIEEIKIRK
ncbi:MAG: hypothetical protein ACFFD5_12070 [Candidatus Thorarchaeota archaeon]